VETTSAIGGECSQREGTRFAAFANLVS
jgi:hypothetical protein